MKWNDYLDAVTAELRAAERGLTTVPGRLPCAPYICIVIDQLHSNETDAHWMRLQGMINDVLEAPDSSSIEPVLRQQQPRLYGPMTSLEVRLHWLNLQLEAA